LFHKSSASRPSLSAVYPSYAVQSDEPPLSLDEAFRREGAFVLRMIRRLGVSPADAEDLAQKVFLVLHRRPELLAADVALRSVLFGIVRRVVADHRKGHRRAPVTSVESRELGYGPDQERALEQKDARAALQAAIDRLDQDKREVFVLYELEEMSVPHIARMLGIPAQTAYTRLHAAREFVRRALGRGWR
jgi:RNA polymerase sigma-70 factor, ECF subfamily